MATREQVLERPQLAEAVREAHRLVLYNDDFNTFDWVIESLVKVCDHTVEQADQCAHIVHYNGKCVVKSGPLDDMVERKRALEERGLTAVVY